MPLIDFINSLKRLNEGLNNKEIIVVENDLNLQEIEEITQEDIHFVLEGHKKRYQLKLASKFQEIVIPGVLNICWHYKIDTKKYTGGELSLAGTQSLFVNSAESSFSSKLTTFGKKLYKKGYRFFDSNPNAGDSQVFSLLLKNNEIAPNIYRVDLKENELFEMEIDYFEYVEHCIALKGLYGWQYLFEDINFKLFDFDTSNIGKRLQDYTKLFPGSDVREYLKRYEERGGQYM